MGSEAKDLIRWFKDIRLNEIDLVGGKNASLGEMQRELGARGVRVPNGFAITTKGYRDFVASNGLDQVIRGYLGRLRPDDLVGLQAAGAQVRRAFLAAVLPTGLAQEIRSAYAELGGAERDRDVAVRSSATAEDLPQASFAGQQETYLNVRGEAPLLEACKKCYASLFTDRAISYRLERGYDHMAVALSIGIQEMVRSDLGVSGVMFSIDTETGFQNAVLINASYGLGENIVQGSVNPDEFYVFKPTLEEAGSKPILQKRLGDKAMKLVYDEGGNKLVKNVAVDPIDRRRFCLEDDDILQLARWACLIEEHYSKKSGRPTPMDMEWARDGRTGEIFIVQARPETVQSQKSRIQIENYYLKEKGALLTQGRSIGEKIATGRVRIIRSPNELSTLLPREILVAEKTDPDWEPAMKRATAIVTNSGGRTCHAAIVSRELGLPAVVGTGNASLVLQNGQEITVSCAEGETGFVYEGKLAFSVEKTDLQKLPRLGTKIMLNVANPDAAFKTSFLPNDGVGLARMEFIISNSIKVHPMALVRYGNLQDKQAEARIRDLTAGYPNKVDYFVDRLAQGVAMIAAAFYPKDVIVRFSDFKTNEYAHLIGGGEFEPHEENPMLGFRGASRYYDERYREAFALECRAVRRVRDEMGLRNLKVMIPFCRTLEEARLVNREMQVNGLRRGENGLEIYMMCEIPSNVILAEEFCHEFDGFSIGSNDLTQLVLGVDRDSRTIAHLFDERNPAVEKMIASVIHVAKENGRKIGICGQAPSDYPDFARFLVDHGIDSLSLNPDSVIKCISSIAGMD